MTPNEIPHAYDHSLCKRVLLGQMHLTVNFECHTYLVLSEKHNSEILPLEQNHGLVQLTNSKVTVILL